VNGAVSTRVARGLLAGAAGTLAMSLSEAVHEVLRRDAPHPIDYDVSEHVPIAAARLLRIRRLTPTRSRALFVVTHVGYGTAFGLVREALAATPLAPRRQTAVFFAATEGLALTMFPLLGGTPPPWRWRREVLAASVVEHVVYALAVSAARRRVPRPLRHV
jgi:hypothetical protein